MGSLHFGVNRALEDEADRLIRESLVGVTSMAEKSDILTPWKEKDRRDREVYASSGFPDGVQRRGMYHRVWNPQQTHLNSREGTASGNRISQRYQPSHLELGTEQAHE